MEVTKWLKPSGTRIAKAHREARVPTIDQIVHVPRQLIAPVERFIQVVHLIVSEGSRQPVPNQRDELTDRGQRGLELVTQRVVHAADLLVLRLQLEVHALEARLPVTQRPLGDPASQETRHCHAQGLDVLQELGIVSLRPVGERQHADDGSGVVQWHGEERVRPRVSRR